MIEINDFLIETTPMIATLNILAASLHAEAYEHLDDGAADFGALINLVILVAIVAAIIAVALGILRLLGALLEWIEGNRKLTPAERAAVIEGFKAHSDELAALIEQERTPPCSDDNPSPTPPQARPRRIFTPPPSKFRLI